MAGVNKSMAITNLDYQLTDRWVSNTGQEMLNVYFYRGSIAGGAIELLEAFLEDMVPLIAAVLSSTMTHVSMQAFNLITSTDFDTLSDSTPGVEIGDGHPEWVALGYTLLRGDRNFRNGAKRYGRVPESTSVNNGIASGAQARVDALQAGLANPISTATSPSYTLMLPKTVVNPSPPPQRVLSDLSVVAGVTAGYMTSQNTRKP